jgi:hypothetical protein
VAPAGDRPEGTPPQAGEFQTGIKHLGR